jgi:two-component system KDP operon response regulator KdpE
MTRVLVVDDEPQLLRTIALNLTSRGFEVTTAGSATAALAQIRRVPPDLLLLDLGLPDLDGLEVIRELREFGPELPTIVLSARSASQDKIAALDLGAFDYVTKPFDMNELVARLRAVLRRTTLIDSGLRVHIGSIEVDLDLRIARRVDGTSVHLTRTEWRILEVLLRQPGRLVTGQDLLTAARGDADHTESSYLRIYFAQLRRKLEPEPSEPRYLITEPGLGYRFLP